jgi:hypothetical protein
MESSENIYFVYKFRAKLRGIPTSLLETWNTFDAKFDYNKSTLEFYLSLILSRSIYVTTDRVWVGEWIYWPLIHTTRNYKQLQRHN